MEVIYSLEQASPNDKRDLQIIVQNHSQESQIFSVVNNYNAIVFKNIGSVFKIVNKQLSTDAKNVCFVL